MKLGKSSKWWKSLCLGIACSLSASVCGADNFLSVSEIEPGMEGVAKTVFQGETIEEFPVKVLGVLKDRGPSGDLILAEFSGPKMEKTGGIAHGMSGSPVYIDGKLIGAVAYGWGFSKSHVGMITPIHQMLGLWNEPYEDAKENPWKNEGKLIPLGTPLMAEGFEAEALSFMKEKLTNYQIEPYQTAGGVGEDGKKILEPGSAVAASLVNGDLKLGAVGTVTYVDDNRVLAFGHPFLKQGRTQYFMHNSYIFTVVNSVESPFKLGSIGATVGAITEDRGAGIAGAIDRMPKFIPVRMDILDVDRNVGKKANVMVIEDGDLSPSLIATSVYNFLTKTMDRRGGGTATITYTVRPENSALPTYTRKDMISSKSGVAMKSMDDFYHILDKLQNNSFKEYNFADVAVNVDVTEEQKVARIIDASASPAIASPGDDILIKVKLHTYRGEDLEKVLVYTLPEKTPLGTVHLEVRGGGETPLPYLIEQQKMNLSDEVLSRLRVYKNFDEFFEKLQNIDSNHQIVVEVLAEGVSVISEDKEEKSGAKLYGSSKKDDAEGYLFDAEKEAVTGEAEDVLRVDMDSVIKGDGQLSITVVAKEEKQKVIERYTKEREKEERQKEALKEKAEPKKITLLAKKKEESSNGEKK